MDTEQILNSIVSDYENILSLPVVEQLNKAKKIRGSLVQIIRLQLSNISNIRNEIVKAKGHSSQTQTVLNFIHHLIGQFPHPVFVPSTSQCNELDNETRSEVIDSYKDFLCYFILVLARLLSSPQIHAIHEDAWKLLNIVHQLVKTKNIWFYRFLLEKSIEFFTELVQLSKESTLEDGKTKVEIRSYPTTMMSPIQVSNFEELEELQVVATDILKELLGDIPQFLSDKLKLVWEGLLQQLQYGMFALKTASLKLLSEVIVQTGFPFWKCVQELLLYCVVSVLEYVGSGRNKDDFDGCGASVSVFHLYDEAVTHFLLVLFDLREQISDDGSFPAALYCFSFDNLKTFVQCVSTIAGKQQTTDVVLIAACRYSAVSLLGLLQQQSYVDQQSIQFCTCSCLALLDHVLSNNQDKEKSVQYLILFGLYTMQFSQHSLKSSPVSSPCKEGKSKATNLRLSLRKLHQPSIPKSRIQTNKILLKVVEICAEMLEQQQLILQKISSNTDTQKNFDITLQNCQKCLIIFEAITSCITRVKVDQLTNLMQFTDETKIHDIFILLLKSFIKLAETISNENIRFNKIFSSLIKLAIQALTWNIALGNKLLVIHCTREYLSDICLLSSCVWTQELEWNDLQILPSSNFTRKSLLVINKMLKSCQVETHTMKDNAETLIDCLSCLCLLPGDIAPQWRSLIFANWGLFCNNDDIVTHCVSKLPVFCGGLCSNQQETPEVLLEPLCHQITLFINRQSQCSTQMFSAICKVIQPLALILSANFQLKYVATQCDNSTNRSEYTLWAVQINPLCNTPPRTLNSTTTEMFLLLGSFILQHKEANKTDKLSEMACEAMSSVLGCVDKTAQSQDSIKLQTHWLAHLQGTSSSHFVDADLVERIMGAGEDTLEWDLSFMQLLEKTIRAESNNMVLSRYLHLAGVICQNFLDNSSQVVVETSLRLQIEYLVKTVPYCNSVVFIQLQSLSEDVSKREELFKQHNRLICETAITELCSSGTTRPPVEVLEDLSQIFGHSTDSFVSANLLWLLPPAIVMQQSVESKQKALLTLYCQYSSKSRVDMIMENFKHIFCYAVVKGFPLATLFNILEKETRIQKESLVLLNYGSLTQHLVAHLSIAEDQVCQALQLIQGIKSSGSKPMSLSRLLQPHFLSILTFVNGQLRITSSTLKSKKEILESLICLLKLMDSTEVSSVCVKIINTLCLAQQLLLNSSYKKICCQAWDCLVRCVDKSSLGNMLSHVSVMLLPFLEQYPSMVTKTLQFLVLENSKYTKPNFSEIYFLPDHQSLKRVKLFVEREIKKENKFDNFSMSLQQTLKQMSHENSDVRIHAIKRLRGILQQHQKSIQRHNLMGGTVGDLIQKLISALLQSCRDSNHQVRLLCAKCLGEIGAIDPDKILPSPCGPDSNQGKFYFSFDDLDFANELFSKVVQAFLAARPVHQDISAFALQELLKVYECKESEKDTQGRRLWRSFPEQIQVVLEPHLSSRYMLKKQADINISALKRPILHRKSNLTFREWIGSFCAVLMQMASGVASVLVRGVFKACSAVVRNDINIAMFLLPHAVVEVLRTTSHDDFIVEEIMAVLQSTNQISVNADAEASTVAVKEHITPSQGTHLFDLSAQAIFAVIDHVTRWRKRAPPTSGTLAKEGHLKEKEIASKFLSKIPQMLISMASLRCRAHARALLHFEAHFRESCNNEYDHESTSFLQRIFVAMDESDGVAGAVAVRGVEATPEIQLTLLESTGALQDAAACYERIIQRSPGLLPYQEGYIKCLIDLGQLSTAANYIDGTLASNPKWEEALKASRIEACWRLGQWESLDDHVTSVSMTTRDPMTTWSAGIGRLLLAIRAKEWNDVTSLLDGLYENQTAPLSAASMGNGSYQRGYAYILRLHMLADMERVTELVKQEEITSQVVEDITSMWHLRLQAVQPSFRAREPILSLSRAMLPLVCKESAPSECNKNLGKLWLQSSKLARKSGYIQSAYGGLLSAQQYPLPQYCIEHAKLLWHKGESHRALQTLQRGVSEYFSSSDSLDCEQRRTRAKVMLLVAKLMEESSSFDSNMVLRQYKEVVSYMNDWEDSHFYCAKYYDKLMTTLLGDNRSVGKSHHLYYIMHHYGQALCYGTTHIYEPLTKLLTVWLDYGTNAAKLEKQGKPQSQEDIQRLLDVMSNLRNKLPAHIFYVAFSQLTSRICHPHEPTYSELKEILVKVIQNFPQRALWAMMAISKSSYEQRATRCQEIFKRVTYKDPSLLKMVSDTTKLTNQLLQLCNKPVSNVQPLSINTHFKSLKKLVEEPSFSEIMLPLQKFLTATLPQRKNTVFGSQAKHNPFPLSTVHIVGFNDQVEILSSLQRPKKVSIRASDGTSHTFLCKPKDDLRKDARLTEFAAIVNKCLDRDAESGRRHLRIRTYAVVPLNEECGLIEWVNNTVVFRHIVLPIYKARKLHTTGMQLKSWQCLVSDPLQKKLDIFRNKLLPRHPPVFHEWFLSTFPDPSTWYNARLAYARSLAVMSMVGYILGLGDRHGENILFDSKSGEAMHVDFNCLFNKGQTLEVPEIVPFRLTHNLVNAMGPTKYEGFFRRACEVTMNVLREQREPLMSVLKTFIHDPLVEWSRRGRSSSSSSADTNEKALSHVNDIDKRLRGIIAKNKGLPLSIEGHVHYLIQEATSEENLCQMYIGWAPFM